MPLVLSGVGSQGPCWAGLSLQLLDYKEVLGQMVGSSERSWDEQDSEAPGVAVYLSLQSKLSVLTSAQCAGWVLALLFAMTVEVGWLLVKLASRYPGIVCMTAAHMGYLS